MGLKKKKTKPLPFGLSYFARVIEGVPAAGSGREAS